MRLLEFSLTYVKANVFNDVKVCNYNRFVGSYISSRRNIGILIYGTSALSFCAVSSSYSDETMYSLVSRLQLMTRVHVTANVSDKFRLNFQPSSITRSCEVNSVELEERWL